MWAVACPTTSATRIAAYPSFFGVYMAFRPSRLQRCCRCRRRSQRTCSVWVARSDRGGRSCGRSLHGIPRGVTGTDDYESVAEDLLRIEGFGETPEDSGWQRLFRSVFVLLKRRYAVPGFASGARISALSRTPEEVVQSNQTQRRDHWYRVWLIRRAAGQA
jgi:hypothetical protein